MIARTETCNQVRFYFKERFYLTCGPCGKRSNFKIEFFRKFHPADFGGLLIYCYVDHPLKYEGEKNSVAICLMLNRRLIGLLRFSVSVRALIFALVFVSVCMGSFTCACVY